MTTSTGKLELSTCKFTWKLENFSKLCSDIKELISSPTIQSNDIDGFQWRLNLYPYGEIESHKGYLSLYLRNETFMKIDLCSKIILSDVNGISKIHGTLQHSFGPQTGYGWPNLIKRDSLLQGKNNLPGDVLIITCIIYMDAYSKEEVDIDRKILNNYQALLLDENLSDLTITINDKHIKAHKNILSARSKVFAAMFSHDMKENNTNTITITDISYDIMKELLLFMYSGQAGDLKKNAKALLPAVEKYGIKELKVLCEKSISKNINIEDACEILIIADLYNCSKLKAQVIDYIIDNMKKINGTPGFKSLIRSDPEVFEEVMSAVVKKKF